MRRIQVENPIQNPWMVYRNSRDYMRERNPTYYWTGNSWSTWHMFAAELTEEEAREMAKRLRGEDGKEWDYNAGRHNR